MLPLREFSVAEMFECRIVSRMVGGAGILISIFFLRPPDGRVTVDTVALLPVERRSRTDRPSMRVRKKQGEQWSEKDRRFCALLFVCVLGLSVLVVLRV